jgi:hypothetical protein
MTSNLMDNDKCVTVGKPAWHELGQNFQEPISAVPAHDAMGGSFELLKKQVGVMFDNEFIAVPNSFAIVRGPTNKDPFSKVFGFASDHYHVIQPLDILKKFDEKVGVSISSLGFIQDGKKLFVTWKLETFDVVSGDPVDLYGTVMVGFDTVFSTRLNIGTVRIVCENTFGLALSEEQEEKKKNRGRGTIYSSKHTNKKLLYELGEWMECITINAARQTSLLKSLFGVFAATPVVHEKQAQDLIYTTWPDPSPIPDVFPESLRKEKQEKIDTEAERLAELRVGIYDVFSTSKGIAIDPTYWGLFNSVTQYANHIMPSKKDTAYSIVWGNRNAMMNRFADVLRKDIAQR